MTAKTHVFMTAISRENCYYLMLISFIMLNIGCLTDMTTPIIEEPMVESEVHMHMGFEDPSEPFQVLPNRPIDPTDDGNGCMPGLPYATRYPLQSY